MPRSDRLRRLAAGGLAALTLAGCHTGGSPGPSTSPGSTPRPFTVMSTDRIRETDPAAITDTASTVLSLNVFQRLMTADPGESVLKPDAARDCLFTSATSYTCTLNEKLAFHNGHPLTSSDVKFSIERALRLKLAGSPRSFLSSMRRIETPNDLTVRFVLSRVDTQFGWELATPAASIVDEESYNADQVQPAKDPIVGSGPFQVVKYDEDELQLSRYATYVGRNPGNIASLVYRSVPDSATIEDAMTRGTVDVVWRGLDAAAVTRLTQQVQQSPDDVTTTGFSEKVLTGTRVLQLLWSPDSPMLANKGLRQAIAASLQGDRTSDSVVPGGVPGHVPIFALGGKAKPKVTWKNRINLTLTYDSTAPNGQDIATQVRTRLENTGGLSVQLRPDEPDADLSLVDRKASTPTALAWLQPYLDAPLPASVQPARSTETQFRSTTDDAAAARLLASLQKLTATDLTVLPISQSDEHVYVRGAAEISDTSYGPGWQFGLFGIRNG